jgi:hypothetical protein
VRGCARAGRAIEARERARLAPGDGARLERHLAGCAACAAAARVESRLTRELFTLRTEIPFEVDVAATVRQRIAALGPIERFEVPPRQLGWAAAAAVAGAVALLVAVWGAREELGRLVADAAVVTRELTRVGLALAGGLAGIRLVPARVALRAAAAVLGAAAPDGPGAPPAVVALTALGYAAMTVTITLLVGRDLRRSTSWTREGSR